MSGRIADALRRYTHPYVHTSKIAAAIAEGLSRELCAGLLCGRRVRIEHAHSSSKR